MYISFHVVLGLWFNRIWPLATRTVINGSLSRNILHIFSNTNKFTNTQKGLPHPCLIYQ